MLASNFEKIGKRKMQMTACLHSLLLCDHEQLVHWTAPILLSENYNTMSEVRDVKENTSQTSNSNKKQHRKRNVRKVT